MSTNSTVFIAFKGTILAEKNATLESVDLVPSNHRPKPTIFITVKHKKQKNDIKLPNLSFARNINDNNNSNNNNNINNDINSANNNRINDDGTFNTIDFSQLNNNNFLNNNNNNRRNNNNNNNNNRLLNEEKQCRLCFESDETNVLKGRLFRPCLCSGTMQYIHIGCLNQWRAMAPNERSYYRCDQCQYLYNVEKAKWTYIVEHKRTSYIISSILLFISIIIVGLITFKLPIANYVWNLIEWHPNYLAIRYQHRLRNQLENYNNNDNNYDNAWNDVYWCEDMCNSYLPWKECPYPCFQFMIPVSISYVL